MSFFIRFDCSGFYDTLSFSISYTISATFIVDSRCDTSTTALCSHDSWMDFNRIKQVPCFNCAKQ